MTTTNVELEVRTLLRILSGILKFVKVSDRNWLVIFA